MARPFLMRARRLLSLGTDLSLQALLPRVCALCEAELGRADARRARLCPPCLEALPGTSGGRCLRCALHHVPSAACPLSSEAQAPWDAALAWLDYGYPVDGWIHALKFQGEGALAEGLGHGLARAILRHRETWAPLVGPIDAIVPLPLAPSRLARRGFNQAALIATAVQRAWRLEGDAAPPLRPDWLLRTGDTAPLSGQGASERPAMIHGVYQAGKGTRHGQRHNNKVGSAGEPSLKGRCVLLIDDVMTTGASLAEATRCLRAAGAQGVVVAAAARTPLVAQKSPG